MDNISNMLIILKNGSMAGKTVVSFPDSKIKYQIASLLQKEGYLSSVAKKVKKGKKIIEVGLIYNEGKPRISEVERVSKPSKRVYFGMKNIFPVRNGSGLLVLSTPKGILSGKEAKAEQVGGEVLFKIW